MPFLANALFIHILYSHKPNQLYLILHILFFSFFIVTHSSSISNPLPVIKLMTCNWFPSISTNNFWSNQYRSTSRCFTFDIEPISNEPIVQTSALWSQEMSLICSLQRWTFGCFFSLIKIMGSIKKNLIHIFSPNRAAIMLSFVNSLREG